MGYYMTQEYSEFFIAKEDKIRALKAIQNLNNHETIHDSGGAHFSWVNPEFYKRNTLESILKDWRWSIEFDDAGNVVFIQFDGEKLGEDELLFKTIAPFVKDGSYIEMRGEEGAMWRWVFKSGICDETYPTITWNYKE